MAQANIRQKRMENIGRSLYMEDESKILRRHGIELQKKFTLSLACLIFFFIGAPLGAIIRKGGLGMPLVISVMLFIVSHMPLTSSALKYVILLIHIPKLHNGGIDG